MVALHLAAGADKTRRRHGLGADGQRPQDAQVHRHDSGNVDCKLLQIHIQLLCPFFAGGYRAADGVHPLAALPL